MKKIMTFVVLVLYLVTYVNANSEQTQLNLKTGKLTKELKVNNKTREYIVYVPKSYSDKSPLPLVLSFHGLGSSMGFNYSYTKFNELAEKENFIAVFPNGLSKRWIMRPNDTTDTDFIEALLNKIEKDYRIDSKRIYCVGMSMGGFFSLNLSCQFSDRIAAIASVTGVMFRLGMRSCEPTRPIPILQIHGTADRIVKYSGVPGTLDFWIKHNKTDSKPKKVSIPDADPDDGSTVERYVYLNGDNGVEIHHLKILGGEHKWPGHKGNMDIDATHEVWSFFKDYNLNGKIKK